jgi:DNA-binding XRE family transcriptional regulator
MNSGEFRSLRKRLGVTQVALATLLDVSWITISRIERGISVPRVYALAITALVAEMVPARDAA